MLSEVHLPSTCWHNLAGMNSICSGQAILIGAERVAALISMINAQLAMNFVVIQDKKAAPLIMKLEVLA